MTAANKNVTSSIAARMNAGRRRRPGEACVCRYTGVHGWGTQEGKERRQSAFHSPPLFKDAPLSRATSDAYLDAEVASVHVVPEEQVAGAAGGSAHLEELHQIKELAVDVSTHWTRDTSWVRCVCVGPNVSKRRSDTFKCLILSKTIKDSQFRSCRH